MIQWLKGGHGWTRAALMAWGVCLLLLWVSGVALRQWPAESMLDMGDQAQVLRRACHVLHGVCTWAICLLSGRGLWPHLVLVWHRREHARQWWWGCASLVLLLLLTGSGLMLLYGTGPLLDSMSGLHFWVGLPVPLVLWVHGAMTRQRRRPLRV